MEGLCGGENGRATKTGATRMARKGGPVAIKTAIKTRRKARKGGPVAIKARAFTRQTWKGGLVARASRQTWMGRSGGEKGQGVEVEEELVTWRA